MLRHAAGIKAYDAWATVVGLREGDRYLIINPFFHAFGLKAGILASLIKGATILPQPVFDVPTVMERVPVDRITMLPGPPAIYQTILNHPDLERFDMSSLRLAVTGAAPTPVEMIRRMYDTLGFETVVRGYGLTETHGIATMCRHDDDPETIATTDGRAIPDVEVVIVDDDGNEVPRGEPGEVLIRGYNVMSGYFEDDGADGGDHRRRRLAAHRRHRGDGRATATSSSPTARRTCSSRAGSTPTRPRSRACCSTTPTSPRWRSSACPTSASARWAWPSSSRPPGTGPTEAEIIAWAREHMANYKAPRYVELVDALPMNASNKVLKTELRSRAQERLGQ